LPRGRIEFREHDEMTDAAVGKLVATIRGRVLARPRVPDSLSTTATFDHQVRGDCPGASTVRVFRTFKEIA
jgi:hypothetical protein